jgi:GNAT superfamily N-acetyltransferase
LAVIAAADEITLRAAAVADAESVAAIWYAGWKEAHLGNVPGELVAARTEESFHARARERVPDTTVAVVRGEVAGFVMVEGDEVDQVYVAVEHRGAGVAGPLLDAARQRVRDGGFDTAWLAVVAANERARRFYARRGWVDRGLFDHTAPGPDGPITVPAHRYEIDLTRPE